MKFQFTFPSHSHKIPVGTATLVYWDMSSILVKTGGILQLSRPVPDISNNHCLSVGMTRISYFLVSYCDITNP